MSRWSVEVRTAPDPSRLAADLRAGWAQTPASIPPKWFYDDKGSQLFDAITELPEYYPTRTEQAILAASSNVCTGQRIRATTSCSAPTW